MKKTNLFHMMLIVLTVLALTSVAADFYSVGNVHSDQASCCGRKSLAAPGTLYS